MVRRNYLGGLGLLLLSPALLAGSAAAVDHSHIAFTQARGEASRITAGADHPLADTAFRPIPLQQDADIDAVRLRLGFDLFHERSLSRDGTMACNSCHSGMRGGSDGLPVARGIGGALGDLNTPSSFNTVFNFRQFRDGRALTLAEQALGPIEHPLEMGHELDAVVASLKEDPRYAPRFAAVYPDGVSANNLGDALAYFQSQNLVRADSPFLRHLAGEADAMNEQELRGMETFQSVGCASCHNGINLGGNSYQKLGAMLPYYDNARVATPANDGVYDRTGREQDRHVFKVPTLHNIAESGPWFHDGSIATLEEAVEEMAEHQLGIDLSREERDDIAAFLHALTSDFMAGMGRSMRGMGAVGRDADLPSARSGSESQATPGTNTLNQQHHRDYQEAMAAILHSSEALKQEAERVANETVAHFDFLQYQHIEMLRHARALAHPPAVLSAAEQAQLTAQAGQLLDDIDALEWLISDFLQAVAVPEAHDEGATRRLLQRLAETTVREETAALQQHYNTLIAQYTEGAAQ